MVAKSIQGLFVLVSLMTWMSCQIASSGSSTPLSASVLSEEYERSSAAVRSKFDGKEIMVRGYAAKAPTMPRTVDDQGSILMEERSPISTDKSPAGSARIKPANSQASKAGNTLS